jgi:hypothetical protein
MLHIINVTANNQFLGKEKSYFNEGYMFHIYMCHVKNKEVSSNMHIEIYHIYVWFHVQKKNSYIYYAHPPFSDPFICIFICSILLQNMYIFFYLIK